MRADRLLSIVLSLQTGGTMSAQSLAEKMEVSERTIFRDIDALNFAGFPIYAVRGPHGGFVLDERCRIDISDVTRSELRNLLIGRLPGPLTDLDIGSNQRVTDKLITKLPHSRQYEAMQFSKRIYLDPSGWFTGHEAVPYLEMIQKAMWNYHWIQIDYQKGDGKIVSREVAPYGLVAKTDFWYLIAKHEDVMRVYRVSRVRNMQITGRSFVFPANFNLSQFWLAWCQEFEGSRPCYSVTVRAEKGILKRLNVDENRIHFINREKAGLVVTKIQFETFEQAFQEILSLGSDAEVIQPVALREKICKNARQLFRLYQEK